MIYNDLHKLLIEHIEFFISRQTLVLKQLGNSLDYVHNVKNNMICTIYALN